VDVLKRFYEVVANSLSSRGQEIHVSDIVYDCVRRCYYQVIDRQFPQSLDMRTMLRFWIGDAIHTPPILKHHHLKLTWEGIYAEVDEYEDGVLVEKKHTSYFMSKIPYHYERQAEYYKAILENNGYPVKEVHILLIDIRGPSVRDFVVETRPTKEISREILFKRDLINYSRKVGVPPPKTVGIDCEFCRAAAKCMKE